MDWANKGEITADEKEEIILLADDNDPLYWRPLVYVIPRSLVEVKLKPVALGRRASFGNEFIIDNLIRTEFDIIEID